MYWSHAAVNPLEVYRSAFGIVILNTDWCQALRQGVKVFRNRDKCHESPLKKISPRCQKSTLAMPLKVRRAFFRASRATGWDATGTRRCSQWGNEDSRCRQ